MSRSRLSLICMSICAAIIAIPHTIALAVERAAVFLFYLLPTLASNPRLSVAGPSLAFASPGHSLDPALQNSMRHEAGMRPLT
jgi:hypothetical protein